MGYSACGRPLPFRREVQGFRLMRREIPVWDREHQWETRHEALCGIGRLAQRDVDLHSG